MKRKKRYQRGSLTLRKGATGAWWDLRYRDNGIRKTAVLGTLAELPTKSDAQRAAATFLAPFNGMVAVEQGVSVEALVTRFCAEEMPAKHSTRSAYRSMFAQHILPRWGNSMVHEVETLDVEAWLKTLMTAERPGRKPRSIAPKTKANIRNLMHGVFECGRRWKWVEKNPIELVRQSARRTRKLPRISPQQFQLLLGAMIEPRSTMVMVAGLLGLRIGEILALKWSDVDWQAGTLSIRRAIYQGHIDETKTAASERMLPLPQVLLAELQKWRDMAAYQHDTDFIFAGDTGNPMWADNLRKRWLIPTAESLGIGPIGWHAFRHLFASVLQVVGADEKVAQELMGHADPDTTRRIYTHAFEESKRTAAMQVSEFLMGLSGNRR